MWNIIEDNKTRQVWECPDCGNKVNVYPPEYEDIGTPICGKCDCDMIYLHTEINNANS